MYKLEIWGYQVGDNFFPCQMYRCYNNLVKKWTFEVIPNTIDILKNSMLDFWGSEIEVTSFITKQLRCYTMETNKICYVGS